MAIEQKPNISDKFRKFWQLHWKCVMVGLAIIIVVIITGWIADRVTDSSRYLNAASIVLSIALSLVVIGYTVLQYVIAAINRDRMERLIEKLGQKVEDVREGISKIREILSKYPFKYDRQEYEGAIREVGKGQVYFSLVATSHVSRLFAHFLLRSHELKKPLPIERFISIAQPLEEMSHDELHSYVFGILCGMTCCLKDFVSLHDQTHVHLFKLPTNFREHLEAFRRGMIAQSPEMDACFDKIDSITV